MSLYDDLGVPADADFDQIKRAHRSAAKKAHPDNGGDAEEFHKVSRAWMVLSDPDRRERYDRDGDEAAEPDNAEAELHQIIARTFDEAMEMVQDLADITDIVEVMRDIFEGRIEGGLQGNRSHEAHIAKAEKHLKRIKFKGKGPNAIAGVLEQRIRSAKENIEKNDKAVVKLRACIEKLVDYEWSFDQPPMQPQANWTTTAQTGANGGFQIRFI